MKKSLLLAVVMFALHCSVAAQNTKLSYRLALLANDREFSEKSVSVLIQGDPIPLKEELKRMGGKVLFSAGNITSAQLAGGRLESVSQLPYVIRLEEGRIPLQPMNDRMLINNRIDLIHAGAAPLPQGYSGKDVVLGIIDTGIDFTHPDFKDSSGQSRILWIWDHLLPVNGNTPATYGYGQQFSKANIDAGSAGAHIDQTAHGTHVAGIAAASGDSFPAFKGAAPKADIIAVSLDFNQDDETWLGSIADAVAYIFNKADSLNKPCVINISAGTYYGPHDGKDLSTIAIDNLIKAKSGRMVVASAGNAGDYPLHLSHQLNNDSAFTWFRANGTSPIYIEFWADTADLNTVRFTLGADKITPLFQDRAELPWTNIFANKGILSTDTLRSYNGNRIATVQRYGQLIGSRYSMIYFVIPDSTTYYFRLESSGNGKFDLWSFDMISNGLPVPAAYPSIVNYQTPDFTQNICSGFQNSDVVLCIGQYINRNNYVDFNGNLQTFPTTEGMLASSSSRGPTRDGRTKPDITSTGEVTLASLKLSSRSWFIANQPYKLAQGGYHIRDGGTSSAAPAVAGAIALYLQQNPNANWQDIRNRVLFCSKTDNFTGINLPDNNWGHGKFDAFTMFTGCTALGIKETALPDFTLYPNPASDLLTVRLNNPDEFQRIAVYSSAGQKVTDQQIGLSGNLLQVNRNNLASGLYLFVLFNREGKVSSRTFIWE